MFRKFVPLLVLTAALIQTTPSLALFLLDEVMNQETQKNTGVANLNPNQKIALETWLNQTFDLKPAAQAPQTNQTAELFLSINIDGGKKLQLSDGSIWEVDPDDVVQSSVWVTPFAVKIMPSNTPEYPSLLINKISGVSVKARKVELSPPAPPKATPAPQK